MLVNLSAYPIPSTQSPAAFSFLRNWCVASVTGALHSSVHPPTPPSHSSFPPPINKRKTRKQLLREFHGAPWRATVFTNAPPIRQRLYERTPLAQSTQTHVVSITYSTGSFPTHGCMNGCTDEMQNVAVRNCIEKKKTKWKKKEFRQESIEYLTLLSASVFTNASPFPRLLDALFQ